MNTLCETYKIQINGKKYETEDPILPGSQLLKLSENKPKDHIIYELLSDGEMEHIRPNETTDLRKEGIEQFKTFKTDRMYRFVLDDVDREWGAPEITGKALKKIAEVNPKEYEIRQHFDDQIPLTIGDKDTVNLDQKGVESLSTHKRKQIVKVCYGDNIFEIEKGEYTTEQLIHIFCVPDGYDLDLVVDGEFIKLEPGHSIKIKKGMKFISHAPKGESS